MQGIKDGWDSFINWLGDLWNGIVESFKDFFGIHSPSTLMAEMGGYLMEGLLGGIEGLAGNVKQAWDSMKQTAVQTWETVKQNIGSKWEQIKSNSKAVFSNIANTVKTSWDNIKSNAKSAADNVKNNIATAWRSTKENTRTSWESIKNSAIASAKSLASNIRTKYADIKEAVYSFTSSAPSLWKNAWSSMGDKVSSVLSSIKQTVSNVFNWISNSIKNLGNSLKNLASKASSVGRSGSSRTSYAQFASARSAYESAPYSIHPVMATVDTSNIPGYAAGQVIPARMKQHLAILGDNNRETEVVSPLSTIRQALREEAIALGLGGTNGNGNMTLKVYLQDEQLLNSKKIFDAVIRQGKIEQMSTGKNRLLLEN